MTEIVFEHPLNERIRTLLRLEFVFGQIRFALQGDEPWHSRWAIQGLLDVLGLMGRGDLRTEIIKELERLQSVLTGWRESPGVDEHRLDDYVRQCEALASQLKEAGGSLGSALKGDEFLNAIMQRSGIVGGTCGFDLPALHRWLHRPAEARNAAVRGWLEPLLPLEESTSLVLTLIRNSATPRDETAAGGNFQKQLDRGNACQLIQVRVPDDRPLYPEISGNRHFCTVRFMLLDDTGERAQQTREDVPFRFACCVI